MFTTIEKNNGKGKEECRFVAIDFIDTGHGIPESNIKKIFDPFFTTKEMGTGLGLSLSYGIINKHGGEIKVNSQSYKGSNFKVRLPIP